ncbi:serine/threonine-protein kinase [Nostoc parmelioides]|uniref:non-specific serine/threonine protein kinase n=1 Tax=Nostoc parmelioides FACHB-3921 TaxID=2692909 RepID=A0ABR8BAZ6_9NOSO|nr:serine/threonine-protein kinase [Nostoc parmelioides]MBD2251120.1 protein kinase [Nostoc parmelioides FACHB-3921]
MSLCINPVCPNPNHPHNDKNRFCQSCGSQLELLGRYRVTHLLSDTTGFATVYEAYEENTAKILKILKANLSSDPRAVELFRQEAVVLGQLNHPGIPKVDSYFQHQTRNGVILHCIVMEKITGTNLEEWLQQQQNQPISQAQAITWLIQLAEILDLVHGKLYLHLDIKPSNILLQPDGKLVLIHFGTAKTYSNGTTTPTLLSGYNAPEQMNGEATPQSDFFSLGRTFVFLLTGKHPLDMYDVHQNLLRWRNHTKQIASSLLNFIDWLIAPESKNRPTNTQGILQRLRDIEQQVNWDEIPQSEQQTQLKSHLPLQSPTKIFNKVPLIAFCAALIVSVGLLSLVAFMIGYPRFTLLPPPGQSPQRKGKIAYFPYETGKDSQGRVAKFNIAVLSIEYKWLSGSNFQIRNNDRVISLDVLKLRLEQEGIQEIMDNPEEIISVGTASCEGSLSVAQRKAFERSQQIQNLVKKLFQNSPSVKKYRLLNLGKFQGSDCQSNRDLTAYQRSVIIIGLKRQSKAVVIDEALRDRLESKPFGDFQLDDYSLGSVDKFKTIPSKL